QRREVAKQTNRPLLAPWRLGVRLVFFPASSGPIRDSFSTLTQRDLNQAISDGCEHHERQIPSPARQEGERLPAGGDARERRNALDEEHGEEDAGDGLSGD